MTTKLTPALRKMHLQHDTTEDFAFLDDVKYQEALRNLQEACPDPVLAFVDRILWTRVELPALIQALGRPVKMGRKPALKRVAKVEQFTLNLAA